MKTILILDTRDRRLEHLGAALRKALPDRSLEFVFDSRQLVEILRHPASVEMVFIDCFVGDGSGNGMAVISEIRSRHESLPIVAVAERGDVEIALKVVSSGASNFLVLGDQLEDRVATLVGKTRPWSNLMELNEWLREQNRILQEQVGAGNRIVGKSPQIQDLARRIHRVAKIPRPVLIVGERGTGKELVARAIHAEGGDAGRPLVSVNCAALAESLLESELFGHEKGAFTGADSATRGKFEQASGGTLFLDEVGAMSLPFQQKILRTVEYAVITRVGGTAEIPVNVRIIAATNVDLEDKMKRGEFLRDLYDRLAFEVIHVAPLRERTGDVEVLAEHFLRAFMMEVPALQGKRLGKSALAALRRYRFPGNVRELRNIIERAAYRDTTNEITPEDLGFAASEEAGDLPGGFAEKTTAFKRRLLDNALLEASGNQAQAARLLGLSYHQFRYLYRTVFSRKSP